MKITIKNPARARPLSANVRRLLAMACESPPNPDVEKISRDFNERYLAYCDMQGNIFMAAVDRGVSMDILAPLYMTSQLAGVMDQVEQALLAVLDHLLKIRPIVCFGRHGPVDIVLKYRNAVLFGIGCALTNLALDAFLALVVGGITGIDNGFHSYSPSITRSRVSFSFTLAGEPSSKHISMERRIMSLPLLGFLKNDLSVKI